jgi:hypothetical protein
MCVHIASEGMLVPLKARGSTADGNDRTERRNVDKRYDVRYDGQCEHRTEGGYEWLSGLLGLSKEAGVLCG